MLSNIQSLALTGFLAAGIFVFGVLDVLDNFIVLTLLTLAFFAVVVNIFYVHFGGNKASGSLEEKQSLENNNSKKVS